MKTIDLKDNGQLIVPDDAEVLVAVRSEKSEHTAVAVQSSNGHAIGMAGALLESLLEKDPDFMQAVELASIFHGLRNRGALKDTVNVGISYKGYVLPEGEPTAEDGKKLMSLMMEGDAE